MNCRNFIDRLEDLLDGRLSPELHRELDRHCRACASCRELRATFEAEPAESGIDPPSDLLPGVLAGTCGSACDRARELLCDHVDDSLEAFDRELMRTHLGGCPECTQLERALLTLREDLPSLAEVEPDARFVDDVLARTLPRPGRLESWAARVSDGWRQLIHRPRIAWEGAYVGALGLAMMFGIPSSPLAGLPEKALELARVNPVTELEAPVGAIEQKVSTVWRGSQARLADRWNHLCSDLSRESAARVEGIRTELGTLLGSDASDSESREEQPRSNEADRTQGETE